MMVFCGEKRPVGGMQERALARKERRRFTKFRTHVTAAGRIEEKDTVDQDSE